MVRAGLAMVVAGSVLPSEAWACGGFFCSAQRPVDQAAEEIVFAVADGVVTMHVKIEFTGESDDFAWVVPVPQVPELQIGTDALFPVLSGLRAQFTLNRDTDACAMLDYASSSSASPGGSDDGVEIVSTGVVGPYETVVLQATDSTELVLWLGRNGFDLPATFDAALAPYVAEGQYFVALKLAKDRDVGDLEPLVLTWPGTLASIPIQLTSVAATPDMRLRVYVLGEHRAVPQSYLHVVLNELAVDWWTGGANLDDVITLAADEAGGHGFFTDYSGRTGLVTGRLHVAAWDTLPAALASTTTALDALLAVLDSGVPLDDAMMGVLSDELGLPEEDAPGVDLAEVLACLRPPSPYGSGTSGTVDPGDCYPDELAALTFDPAALGAAVEAVVLEPRRRTEAMLAAHHTITRLTSSVSPTEMTVDPTFVFNPTMADVPLERTAVEIFDCAGEDVFDAPRRLQLSDGRTVQLPSMSALTDAGQTEIEWLAEHGYTTPTTARIEQAGSEGDPEVLVDNTDLLNEEAAAAAGIDTEPAGCGCAQRAGGGPLAPLLALGIVAPWLRRRRGEA